MRIKTAIAWMMVLMLVVSTVGCSQPAAEVEGGLDMTPMTKDQIALFLCKLCSTRVSIF